MRSKVLTSAIFFAVVALIYSIFSGIKSCQRQPLDQPKVDSTAIWKSIIQKDMIEKDSLKKLAKRKDSVKIEYRIKWLTSKTNPGNLPCDSLVPIIIQDCDSALASADDYEGLLNYIIQNDSAIIANQRKIIVSDSIKILHDSLQIVDLSRQIRKHKRQKKAIIVGAGIVAGVLLLR